MDTFSQMTCVACTRATLKVPKDVAIMHLEQIPGWNLSKGDESIETTVLFTGFMAAMDFLNRLATLCESEKHHADFSLYKYDHVTIKVTTHAIRGLSVNDFILASKINALIPGR